jgi:uncharacterized CHY-type Zn-finger protein
MNLRNPFSDKVRYAFLDYWECYQCGSNGNYRGGLELHHIKGRESNSALNSCILCGVCHTHIGHTQEEEIFLMRKTIRYLVRINYEFTKFDLAFYNKYKKLYDSII